jgi:hypothetical protein
MNMRVSLRYLIVVLAAIPLALAAPPAADPEPSRRVSDPPEIHSSWDDLLEGVKTLADWQRHKKVLRGRYLELIRDSHKPAKPPLDLKVHEEVTVADAYVRKLISYNVEADERAHAYLALPCRRDGKVPGIVALHGTHAHGKEIMAALEGNPNQAHLDHLARRGYVVIAPDHFVAGHRIPPEGSYETARFHRKHPQWTAVGKFTYEHAIAIDILQSLPEVDGSKIGVLGHSLGGHGSTFLGAYDERVKVCICNCGSDAFRHNPKVLEWSRDRWYAYLQHLRPQLLKGELPPIDYHEILALIAPRAYLDLSGLNDGDPLLRRQLVLMHLKLMDVYNLEKVPQNMAFYVHGQGHSVNYESQELMFAWLDKHLRPERTQRRLVK